MRWNGGGQAARRRQETLFDMSNWQPIDTAPRDGTRILIWRPSIGRIDGRAEEGWWETQKYHNRPRPYWESTGWHGIGFKRNWPPTHWMPLPEEPGEVI